MPRERLPVHDVMGPNRVRDDDYVALVLGSDVSQLEYEGSLQCRLETAKNSNEGIPVNLCGVRGESR